MYFYLLEKPNVFQQSFVTIVFFVIISATSVHPSRSERKRKMNSTVKNLPTNNCNTMLDTTKKICDLN